MRLFKQYFKLPFKLDDWGQYVWDANGKMILQFSDEINDKSQKDIVEAINSGKSTDILSVQDFVMKNAEFFYKGEFMFCIRGFGYLTGTGGLNLSDQQACEIQDDLAQYILNILTNQL